MLPSVDAQQRRVLSNDRILVRVGSDLHLACFVVFYEPGPAAALDAGESGVESVLERGEGTVRGFDCCLGGLCQQNHRTGRLKESGSLFKR